MSHRYLTQALTTVEEMLEDRNYIPISSTYPELDIEKRLCNRKYFTPNGKYAFVTVVESTSNIKNFASMISDEEYETILFVYTNNVTVAHKAIEKNLNFKVEIWSIFNLMINVARHYLQPKVERIDEIHFKGKIAKISIYDPLVRYYKFSIKDILKITSKEGFINYRIVV